MMTNVTEMSGGETPINGTKPFISGSAEFGKKG
jgi:hypothetical protein